MRRLEQVTAATFEERVLGADVPVLVEFTTSTCPACHAAAPAMEKLAEEFEGRALVLEATLEKEPGLGRLFQIQAVPTLVFFKDGAVAEGMVGAAPASVLRRKLERLSGSCAPKG